MPVTRHPPCRPGRAGFPHPVPRLYALPRCKAAPSSIHSTTSDFGDTRPCYPYAVKNLGALLPGITLPLAPSSVKPLVRTLYGPPEEALKRVEVPPHPRVLIGSRQPCMQPPKDLPSWQVPLRFEPCRDPPTSSLELLAGRTPLDAWPAVPIWSPGTLNAHKRAAPLQAGVTTAEA
jgi:hypothetical protein